MLRRVERRRLCLWLALSAGASAKLRLDCGEEAPREFVVEANDGRCRVLKAGETLFYLLIDLPLESDLPLGREIGYDLALRPAGDDKWIAQKDWAPDLCYPGRATPCFRVPDRLGTLLHGSCRKPHYHSGDGLVAADRLLARCLQGDDVAELPARPALLALTGDQIYADDVAGPMLRAVHRLLQRLGLPNEKLPGLEYGLEDSQTLYGHTRGYYRRETLLPRQGQKRALLDILFSGVKKPIFTTDTAHNHLITLGEVLAMYLLVWSPAPWEGLDLEPPDFLDARQRRLYETERAALEEFVKGLPAVRRALAHLPTAMIFDDHDVTDDWNISREWEETAYEEPFSRRVIGNALLAYLVNQGWGNRPEAFDAELMERVGGVLAAPGDEAHDDCIEALLRFEDWQYRWPTWPPLVVIDSRTRRWRSEVAAGRPSGLLDWEALTDLQYELRDETAVLLVSPAPVFGVKLIEALQRVFTWFGKPLLVDAENWMAHPGAAHAMLNVFRHRRTPQRFVFLSGDVHYSFVYDVELRGRVRGPDIWQICSSGLRNSFPARLLAVLDHANRWLYSPRSPLNWFTRRRRMRVVPRKPEGTPHGRRLLDGAGIGVVELGENGAPRRIRELLADGTWVLFSRREEESHWD